MASPAASLLDALHPSTKALISNTFWGPQSTWSLSRHDNDPFGAYWKFYHRECERALHDGGRHVLARTHQDLLDVVAALKRGESRETIQLDLRKKLTKTHDNEDELVDRSIDLAAGLWLMVDFGNTPYGFCGRRQLQWSGQSFKDCVASGFDSTPWLGHKGVKLQRVFNALNLDRIAGVEILPTSNLLDHLRLIDDDTKLYVFHHASVLKCQVHNTTLPDGLVVETIRTLALLFPQSDPAISDWSRQLSTFVELDSHLLLCGHLKTDDRQIENFTYWHDRLVVLKQVFDEATPRNLSSWWHDRRNGVQWYTFWVAVVVLCLTTAFGLIQSIEGALQVYGTFRGEKGV
ncbi:Nn.00g104290.m01.CDS01 [Neocucurbitaria sp. VM-36]